MKKTFCVFLSIVILVFSFPAFDCKADTVYFSDFYHQGNLPSDSTLASEIYSASSDKITSGFMTAANSVVYSDEFKQHKFFLTCMYDVTGYLDIYGISNVTNTYLVYVDDSHIMMLFEVDNSIGQTYSCQYKSNGDDYSGGWLVDNNFYYINQNYNDVSLYGLNIGNGNRRVVSTYNTDYVINYDQFYDDSGVPYTDSTAYAQLVDSLKNGSFVPDNFNGGSDSGEDIESNVNHLTLSNFNIQFCKPYDLNDIYSRAGGGYAVFTYDFDSWVNSHSSDYQLNIITQIDVDGQTYTYPNVRNLDVSGVLVLPFSGLAPSYQWSNENLLFVQYPNKLFGNYYLGYIYSLTYQKYYVNAERFLGSGRSNRLFFKGHNVNSDFPDLVGSQVEELFSSVTHSNFKISFTVTMVDTVSGERSGSYVKTFDLLNGVYNVTNNTIQDNQNPFDYTEEPYLPVDGSGGGYLPSTNNNLVTNNINIPSDYTVTYRDGVNEFIDWYNQDSEVSGIQDTVWGSFGVFRDNPAIDLYEEYFGFLPAPFKSVIFGCGTIGIVGGAACVLRKRLMK